MCTIDENALSAISEPIASGKCFDADRIVIVGDGLRAAAHSSRLVHQQCSHAVVSTYDITDDNVDAGKVNTICMTLIGHATAEDAM